MYAVGDIADLGKKKRLRKILKKLAPRKVLATIVHGATGGLVKRKTAKRAVSAYAGFQAGLVAPILKPKFLGVKSKAGKRGFRAGRATVAAAAAVGAAILAAPAAAAAASSLGTGGMALLSKTAGAFKALGFSTKDAVDMALDVAQGKRAAPEGTEGEWAATQAGMFGLSPTTMMLMLGAGVVVIFMFGGQRR